MDSTRSIAFLEFTEKNERRLREAYLYIRQKLPDLMETFYESLAKIDSGPEQFGVNSEALKKQQIEHWHRLFQGTFDTDFENKARRIAIRHFEIGLQHDLYVLSYMKILTLFTEEICNAPAIDREHATEMIDAITKAVAIDMVFAMSPYTGDLV